MNTGYSRQQWFQIARQMASIMGQYDTFTATTPSGRTAYRGVYLLQNDSKLTFFFSDSETTWQFQVKYCYEWLEANGYSYSISSDAIDGSRQYAAVIEKGKRIATAIGNNQLAVFCKAFLQIAGYDIMEVVKGD